MQDELRKALQELYREAQVEQAVFYRLSQRSTESGNAAALYSISMKLNRIERLCYEALTSGNNEVASV